MRRLIFLVPVLAVLGGCADSAYYDARYQPTDIGSTYAIESKAFWTGNHEDYELPAAPPDLNDDAPPRTECAYPYQHFKPDQLVGYGPEPVAGHPDNHPIALSKYDDVHPTGPTTALPDPLEYGTEDLPGKPGIPPKLKGPTIGKYNDMPASRTGAGTDTIPPMAYAGWNTPSNPYCCGENTYRMPKKPATPTPAATPAAPAPAAPADPAK